MRTAVTLRSVELEERLARKPGPVGRVLLRILQALSRRRSDSFEKRIARSIDRGFAEFATEMRV
jgi:hypothetical protein